MELKKNQMRLKTNILILLFLFFFSAKFCHSETYTNIEKPDNSIIVKFKEHVKKDAIENKKLKNFEKLNKKHNLESKNLLVKKSGKKREDNLKEKLGLNRIYYLKFKENSDINKILKDYKDDPDIEYAEPDHVSELHYLPHDQFFSTKQWNLHNDRIYNGRTYPDIDSPEAWDITRGDNGITIAIIDTGIQTDHPDLCSKITFGYDIADTDYDPSDFVGHGTHVAGIAAAVTDNGIGVAGVCPDCKIMPVKVTSGTSNLIFHSNAVNGIIYAVDHGADVINISSGGGGSMAYQDAISYAYSAGKVVVASTGNDSSEHVYYPAGYKEVIAVGASGDNDERSFYSNYGPHVDVVAPGTVIYSTYVAGSWCDKFGTSMAAPHVAGVAGLLLSNNPSLSPDQVKWHIELGAQDQGGDPVEDTSGWDRYHGWGRLNAHNALQPIAPGATFSTESAYADSYYKGVSPDYGDINTAFTFKVIYIDENNQAPSFVQLCLGGNCYDMAADASASSSFNDGNYVNGEQYAYTTALSEGNQDYFFSVSNGITVYNLPQVGALTSPTIDICPDDPNKLSAGFCGCGIPDTDTDADGTPDCIDLCVDDPLKTEQGQCGCGELDTNNVDSDTIPDCIDNCPLAPNGGQADADGDQIGDACDGCPNDPSVKVHVTQQSYSDKIQSVYNDPVKVFSGETILLQNQLYEEGLVFDRDIEVILRGCHNCQFDEIPASASTIRSLKITKGLVVVDNIVVRSRP